MKKTIALIFALCLVGGVCPEPMRIVNTTPLTASAEDTNFEELYKEVYTEGALTYGIDRDYAEVIQCSKDARGEITIPDNINGVTVNIIAEEAFKDCTGITAVTIPESVLKVNEYAFSGCTSLKTVKNRADLQWVADYAFSNCKSLEGFLNPVFVQGANVLRGCTSLKSLEIADLSDTSLSYNNYIFGLRFVDCPNLESVIIPESCILMNGLRLENCPALKEVIIPQYTEISDIIILGCDNLTRIKLPLISKNILTPTVQIANSNASELNFINDLGSTNLKIIIKNMPELEKIEMSVGAESLEISGCEKLKSVPCVTRPGIYNSSLLSCSTAIDYETCPAIEDLYCPKAVSEIPDISTVVEKNITVHISKSNTALKKYLESYNAKIAYLDEETLLGDANCDSIVNIADAVAIMQAKSNPDKYQLSEQGLINADVDGNAGVTVMDALEIQKYVAKLIDKFGE